MSEFESTVSGIPCIIKVTGYVNDPGRTYGLPENCYPAEFEFEYEVLDRKGYRAEWLERKLTDNDNDRLAEEYSEYMVDQYYD